MTDVINEDQVHQYFIDLFVNAPNKGDYTPTMQEFHTVAETRSQESFTKRESPSGMQWRDWEFKDHPLVPDSHHTLVLSGRLLHSTLIGGPKNRNRIEDKNGVTTGEFGSDLEYARTHQFGYSGPSNVKLFQRGGGHVIQVDDLITIDPRPFVGVKKQDVDELAKDTAKRTTHLITKTKF